MQKGIFTCFGYNVPYMQRLQAIKDSGFQAVMLDWSNADVSFGDREQFTSYALKLGLTIENAHMRYLGVNNLWLDNELGESIFQELNAGIINAGECGIPRLIVHVTNGFNPPEVSQIGFDRFSALIESAVKSGVKLAFENLKRIDYLEQVLALCPTDDIGVCYDVGHNHCFTQDEGMIERYKDKIIAIHVHDNDLISDRHLIPFNGKIDFEKEFALLSKTSYKGALTLECYMGTQGLSYMQYLKNASVAADKLIDIWQSF